jgi:hypothetical protein
VGIERKDHKTIHLGASRFVFLTTYYLSKKRKEDQFARTLEGIGNIQNYRNFKGKTEMRNITLH